MRDLYEILGISQDASDDEVKSAYRKRAREAHPDAGGDESDFKDVTTAYEILKNPEARANYDRYGDPRGPTGATTGGAGDPFAGFGDLSDLIDAFFGGGFGGGRARGGRARRGPEPGRDAIVDVRLTLEEAAAGVQREVEVTVPRPCDRCDGQGTSSGGRPVTCETCGGAGAVQQVTRSVLGQMLTTSPCPNCRGEGTQVTNPCSACGGEGRRQTSETVTVDVPPGVDTGTRLRVGGGGEAGRRGSPSGDLYVRVRLAEHDLFVRDGSDLHSELDVPMTQATLGAELKIPTLDGEEELAIPAGTQTGDKLTVRRGGMPKLNGGGARGNLIVHCRVVTPTDLDYEQQELVRELAERRGEDITNPQRGLLSRLRGALRG